MKRDDLDASRGILFGLILSIVVWILLVSGFAWFVYWIERYLP